jgi:hypothetical protein
MTDVVNLWATAAEIVAAVGDWRRQPVSEVKMRLKSTGLNTFSAEGFSENRSLKCQFQGFSAVKKKYTGKQ